MDQVSTASRGSLGLGCASSSNPGTPASRSPALSPLGCGGATIRLGADRAAAGLAALVVVLTVVVQDARLHTVSNWFELGAHTGFLCSGALEWVAAENFQGERGGGGSPTGILTPRSKIPKFQPQGPPITPQRAPSLGQGSRTLERSLMLGFRVPSPLWT